MTSGSLWSVAVGTIDTDDGRRRVNVLVTQSILALVLKFQNLAEMHKSKEKKVTHHPYDY
ncbi:hypothetical protein T01_4334 [Trichinella spiralis]|uniref:Uncharacterized protein n=1 Tax=Trichinella spiralis TaxID=6334 RepID=A0A0V1BDW2_TRISP|nr:hypothetical protein T01_4334 [Trichinella spiralis]